MFPKKKGEPVSKQMNEGEEPEDNGEDENGDTEEEETEKGCAMKKSDVGITGDDLQKSLDHLEELAQTTDTPSRKDALLSKASEGTLAKSEREELFDILGGAPEPAAEDGDNAGDNIVKSMETNEELAGALDVSDYLREQHTELVKSLHAVGEEITKSDNRRMEFDLVMAKAVHDIGTMVKSISESMDGFLEQPARAPKSRGVQGAAHLEKSFAGQAPAGESLSKAMVLDAMDGLMEKSMTAGHGGKLGEGSGEDIALAVAKYEQTSLISKPMLAAVKGWHMEHAAH